MRLKTLTLIRPNMGSYHAGDAMPPLALGILAARTPKEVTVRFFDDRIEEIPPDDRPDLVAITVETFTAVRAYEISKSYRKTGIPVVMGGYHPSLFPEEAAFHADAVVIGDAEGVWEEVLADFESDCLKDVYTGGNTNSLEDYRVDRSIFKNKKYLPVELVQYSRGCKYSCDFCSISSFYGQKIRRRGLENLLEEIRELKENRLFFFVDDNIFFSRNDFIPLLNALKDMHVRWACQISIDIALDNKLLDKLAESGCVMVLIGFESLEDQNLNQMGKKWNNLYGKYAEVIDKFHSRGIAVYGTFVFGYDYDLANTVDSCVKFAIESKLEIANFNLLIPTPGTALYKRLKKEGKLINEQWWNDPEYKYGTVVFNPKQMSPEELASSCLKAKLRFYSFPSIIKRLIFNKTKLSLFQFTRLLIINLVSRREIRIKQNRSLGGA